MKWLLPIALLFPIISFAQQDSTYDIHPLIKYKDAEGISKLTISDSVEVESGIGEKVNVFFILSVPKDDWDAYKNGRTDKDVFAMVCRLITSTAKFQLQNRLSFIPMKKQFVMYYGNKKGNKYISNYKCYGRNGYGNLIETEIFSEYKIPK